MYASLGIVDVVWKLDLATSVKFKIEFNKKDEGKCACTHFLSQTESARTKSCGQTSFTVTPPKGI